MRVGVCRIFPEGLVVNPTVRAARRHRALNVDQRQRWELDRSRTEQSRKS